jgi:multiple sugar transport system permease protein
MPSGMNRLRKWLPFALPGLAGFCVIYIAPFFETTYYSFLSDIFSKVFVWFENYGKVLKNEYFRLAIRNTGVFLVAGCMSVMLVSVVVSYCLMMFLKNSSLIKGIMLVPFLIPSAAVVSAWTMVFDPIYFSYKIPDQGAGVFLAQVPVLAIFIWKNCGLMIIIINTAMQRVPDNVIEASKLDGAGAVKRLTKIILPTIRPNLLFALVLTMAESLKIYKDCYLYYKTDYPPEGAYFLQNYMNNHFAKLDYEILTTATVIFVAVAGIAVAILYRKDREYN